MDSNEKENKEEAEEKEIESSEEINKSNKKDSKTNIYCISCFNSIIQKDNLFTLIVKNTEVCSFKILLKTALPYYINYEFCIYEISLIKRIKKLNLALRKNSTKKNYDLNEIRIKSDNETIILMDDLIINQNILTDFINQLDQKLFIKSPNVIKYIKLCNKFNLYLNCFEAQKNKDELKILLAEKMLSLLKDKEEIYFNDLIKLFNISFEKRIITNFLDTYPKLDIVFNPTIDNEEFKNIVLKYQKNINSFFKKNIKIFKNIQKNKIIQKTKEDKNYIPPEEKYKNLLEDFIIIYLMLYTNINKIPKQKLINVKELFFNLIENKNDIIKVISFLIQQLENIYQLSIIINDNKRFKLKPKMSQLPPIVFEQFNVFYEILLKEQKKKNKFIFDFSDVFNFFVDKLNSVTQLITMKNSYMTELTAFPNKYFQEKINVLIHTMGLKSIKERKQNNNQILNFLINDEVYSNKEDTSGQFKNFEVLKYFNVDKMDDKFFKEFYSFKVYSYFEEDYVKYFKMFSTINNLKHFGLFFKILPPEKHNKETANYVYNKLTEFMANYDSNECPNFLKDIETFYSILNEKTKYQILYNLIDLLKKTLGQEYIDIFIYLLNKFNANLNQKEAEMMIKYILFDEEEEEEEQYEKEVKLNNLYTFIEKVQPNKIIVKIVLNNIQSICITQEDLFIEFNNTKFLIFEKLLNLEDYSLLGNNDNKNYQFWINTKKVCNNIIENLKNLNFIFITIKSSFSILNEEDIIKRISLIIQCLGKDDQFILAGSYYSRINEIINTWIEKIKIIEKIKNYYSFTLKDNKLIHEQNDYSVKIHNSTLQYLNSKEGLEEFSKYTKDYEMAEKIDELRQSEVFVSIFYDSLKRFIKENPIDKSLKRFNNIKNIFVNDKEKMENKLKNNEEIKYLINVGYKNENNIEKEVDWLLNYFKIENFELKSVLIDSIKSIINKKSTYSIISGMIKFFDIYNDILNLTNKEDISLYEKMLNYKTNLIDNNDIKIHEIQEINNFIEFNFDLNATTRKIFFKLFLAIDQYPDSMKFIKDKKFEEVNNLIQFLLESDDTYLTEIDINDFINVVKLLEEIISSIKGEFDIFNKFLKKILEKISGDKKMNKSIFNYIEKYNHIQTLFNDYLKHSEGCIKKIEKILDDSDFTILINDISLFNSFYTIQGSFNDQKKDNKIKTIAQKEDDVISRFMTKKYQHIFYQELESLFQRVYISKVPQKYEASADLYIKFFKNANKLINLFNAFYSKGYQEKFEVQIDFKDKIISCFYLNQKFDIEILIQNFEMLNNEIDRILKLFYSSYEIMRFFYGRQLTYLYINIIHKKNDKILELLRASFGNIFKDCSLENVEYKLTTKEVLKKYYEIINHIYNYIQKQFSFNKIDIKNIFSQNKINIKESNDENNNNINTNNNEKNKNKEEEKEKPEDKYKGIFFYASQKNQEMEILNLYIYMTQNFPINGCFLYCTKDLPLEKLQCFLSRFLNCKENILFAMINIDLLNNELRDKFISLLKESSYKYENKLKSCLVMTFNSKDDDLHKIFMRIKTIRPFPDPTLFNHNFNFSDYFIYKDYIVKSTSCGLGKSEFIKNNNSEITVGKKKQKINFIYFPIGGKFSRKNLVDRLLNLPDMTNLNEKFAIHFDLSLTKEIELLKEFFFKLIIFRKFDVNESARYFGTNVDIIIEIPNEFSDYTKDIEILSKLKCENINNISNINYSTDLNNVAKILFLYETDDILKKQKPDLKKINLKVTHEQMSNMILKCLKDININNPNFYQINIFIKVLADELMKFYFCPGYFAETLINNGINSGMGKENAKKLVYLRKFIINSLIQVTKLFLVGPYESLLKNQEINQKYMNETDEEKERLINNELNIKIDSISFDEIKPSLIVFNEDGNSCTIITTCSEKDPEFKDLQNLYRSQNLELLADKIHRKNTKEPKEKKEYQKLRTFRELSRNEILDNLLNFLNVSGFTEEQRNEILGTYVYTPDNFIKVVLILMRVRVGVPVILMGETGCGKTTLIEMASKLINKGKISLKKLNVHAGITDEDIINFMKNVQDNVNAEDKRMINAKKNEFQELSEENKRAYLKKNTIEKIYAGFENEVKKRKIWVFFDEINTSNSMGLFIEIMCKNSIHGKPLSDRFIYIAACNPYRVSQKENKLLNVLYKKNQKRKNLVYTVNPLPIPLLNFVFNFGNLKEKDEYVYIQSMIEGVTNNLFKKIKDENILKQKNDFIQKETECVQICQNLMKKNNDVSIVSLREVNRFNAFVSFFFDYLTNRKNMKNNLEENDIINFYYSKNDLEILLCSVNLSLFICYYLRIPDKQSRIEICNLLNEKKYFSDGDFLRVPKMEQDYLLDNFEVPVGIAKNKNLKENIFLIFFCIINKIPVIICGKPGKSKTLSFEILQDSMKGPSSKTEFCRQYLPLTAFKIQGSLNTTSEEILNVFNKGRKYQSKNSDRLSVIFMDEMGLAEISENNPLKVMHAELEKEIDKIAFVGISNWFIDASKMNRVIYNVVQDDEEEDLIQTGKEIAKSYEKIEENFIAQKYDNLILRLSKAYYKYMTKKQETNDKNQFFHGSRDFYSLIKSIMCDIIKNKSTIDNYLLEGKENESEKMLSEICINHISRNFGGLEKSVYEFKSYYLEGYEEMNYLINQNYNYDFKKCIQDNINDINSRYLLLINNGNLSQELLNYILEEINETRKIINIKSNDKSDKNKEKDIQIFNNEISENKEVYVKYYIGSMFKSDKNNVVYSNDILNKIRVQMETENILILKDLESVYPALYELFNQNYIYLNGKKFVHLGESKSLSLVNNKFKVIVLVEEDQIENQEPPFLNRFEKHIINFSNLLSEELQELAEEIFYTLNEISNINNNDLKKKHKTQNLESRFKNYKNFIKKEEIQGLVYIGSKQLNYSNTSNEENKKMDKSRIIKFVLERMTPCFSEELMVLITKFGFKQKFNSYYKIIYECYKDKYCHNFDDFLTKSKNNISIVYTFSSIFDTININNPEYSQSNKVEINITNITSIDQINKEIMDFIFDENNYEEENKKNNLMILKFREEDLNKLNNIYYLIDDYKSNMRNKNLTKLNKKIIFIIYMKKINKIKTYLSFLSNCPQIIITNLNNKFSNFPEILKSSNKEIIKNNFFNIGEMISNEIENSLRYFNFKLYNFIETQNNSYKKTLAKNISNSKYAKNVLIECLSNFADNEEDFLFNICINILSPIDNIEGDDYNFSFLLENYIINLVRDNLKKIILILEKEQIITAIISNERLCQTDLIKNYLNDFITNINNEENRKYKWKDKNLNKKVNLTILSEQKFPFCQNIINNLFTFIQRNIASKFLEKDTYFITMSIKDQNIKRELDDYFKFIQKLDENLKFEIYKEKKNKIISDILNSYNEELISNLFEDVFFAFIKKNDKFKSRYSDLSKILNLLIQLRLKTRINNELNLAFIEKEKIELKESFLELIKEEFKDDSKDNTKEDNIYMNEMVVNNNSIYFNIFISVMNFLKSYSNEIYTILELYYFLIEDCPNIYDDIATMIQDKKISMENSKRNSYYNRINKFSFFYLMESLCKILKEKIYDILKLKKDFNMESNYFQSVQYLVQNILQLEKRLLLFSKEIFSLDILMKLISQIQIKNKSQTLFYLSLEFLKVFLSKSDKNDLIQKLAEEDMILLKIFGGNTGEYGHIMSKILYNIYKSEFDVDIREKIIKEIILEDKMMHRKELKEHSYHILKLIFRFNSMELPLEKEQKIKFLELFNEKNSIKKLINNKNDLKINDILFYRFEILCQKYFKNIINKNKDKEKKISQKLCGELSQLYLKDAIDSYYKKSNISNIYLSNIYKLYCIAYIKVYLNYYVDIISDKEKYQEFPEREDVNDILFLSNTPQKNVVKYYLVKLIAKKFPIWETFVNYYNDITKENNDIFSFHKHNNILKLEQSQNFIQPPFLLHCYNIREDEEYNQYTTKLEFEGFNKNSFENVFIKLKKFDYLFIFLSNVSILYYSYNKDKEYEKKKKNLQHLIKEAINYLNSEKKNLDKDILTFFTTFFESKNLNEKIFSKIGFSSEENEEKKLLKIKVLYYSLLFVISIINSPKNKNKSNVEYFYQNLTTKNISSFIDNNYMPGNFQFFNLKMKSLPEIKENLKRDPLKYGAYICSCGYHYTIDKCTFPTREFKCPICQKLIGGTHFNLVKREGHMRIFLDEQSRTTKLSKKKFQDKYVPNILLEQFENEINEQKKELIKGIKATDIGIDGFLTKDEKIREMNDITYRFLNFVLYSFILYGNISGFIKEKNLANYCFENMSCFNILEKDWEIMETLLDKTPVELFINLIFDEVIEKLINCQKFNRKEEAIKFEKEINNIINAKIKDQNLITVFKQLNDNVINMNPNSDNAIIKEAFPYTKYNENNFPDFKYFYIFEFPSEEHFIKNFNSKDKNKDKYPILNNIINNQEIREKLELLKYLPKINKVLNYMINFVSFKYSRDEAKNILVKEEIKDEEFISLLTEFIPIYKKIRPYITQEGCHEFGKLYQEININNVLLNDLCVDSGEMGFGLVLLAMYKELASWQNAFINEVTNSENIQLKNYKNLFNSKIMIQDCELEHILDLPNFNSEIVLRNDKNATLFEMIVDNSMRKENEVVYNYDEIEDELASFILTKIKGFKEEIRKVVYQYECLSGERSSLIIDFMDKYQQRDLTEIELNAVIYYIMSNKNNNKFDMKNFLISLQVLMDIILDESPSINEALYSILETKDNLPYIDIDKNFFKGVLQNIKQFETFEEFSENINNNINNNYLTINCLINLIEIVELFCWENIRNNLDKKYFENITDKMKLFFDDLAPNRDEVQGDEFVITKLDLCSAIRKYLSRYLSGKSEENINPKNLLKSYIIKAELWSNNYDENDIENEINIIFANCEIQISQALKLYDYLGGDSILLDEINNKYMKFTDKYKNLKKIDNIEKTNDIYERSTLSEIINNEIRSSGSISRIEFSESIGEDKYREFSGNNIEDDDEDDKNEQIDY